MELIFLGTGAGMPSKQRNVSSIALTLHQENNHIWLFDCGEATQHQILNTSIKPGKINKIFITHMHGDHIFGLPGVLSSRSHQGGKDELTIYGPSGIQDFVQTALTLSHTKLGYPLSFVELYEGKIMSDQQFTVHCQRLEHGMPSYGFRIEEHDKMGELLVDQLKDAGIQPGPVYQEIKANPSTILPDGRIIQRKDYIGPPKRGRHLAIIGDTRLNRNYMNLIKNVDILVHEATFSQQDAHLADRYFHTAAGDAARLALEAGARELVLTHISSRYHTHDLQQLSAEAQDIFPNTVIARDFMTVPVSDQRRKNNEYT